MERKRAAEERERENHLKLLKEQNTELAKKRERVLSACGIRNPYCNCSIIQYNHQESQFINQLMTFQPQ
jgi:hypothetical protein